MKLKVNDQIPDVKIFHLVDGEPKEQNISEVLGSNKIILLRPKKTRLMRLCSDVYLWRRHCLVFSFF